MGIKPLEKTLLAILIAITLTPAAHMTATPSRYWLTYSWPTDPLGIKDEWGIYRTDWTSYTPWIVYESLGEYEDLAATWGKWFKQNYPDRVECAKRIFEFIRDHIHYTTDIELAGLPEWAQNADETAYSIAWNGYQWYGDCEDYSIILAAMYKAAGYRVALIGILFDEGGHMAVLLHLPEYASQVNVNWKLYGEPGWIWLEATSPNNPFGYTPIEAYILIQQGAALILTYEI